jgi:DNA-binding response OmpR family regulator
VLYVEDEESDIIFMQKAFATAGLRSSLRLASDGRAAIDYLSGAGIYGDRGEYPVPAVVVLDLNLPAVPGFEVLKWMRKHLDYTSTPVVIFSSSTREQDKVKAHQLGANEFLEKPASGRKFLSVVQRLKEEWLDGQG